MNLLRLLLPLSLATFARSAPYSQGSQARAFVPSVGMMDLPFSKHYAEFQISDGHGGSAEEEAALVFVQPFEGMALASVPFEVYDVLRLAKEAAEDVEIELFGPAIADADAGEETPTGRALRVGMAKNRVLFATAAVQALEIKAAHNEAMNVEDPYEEPELEYFKAYLAWTIDADKENGGEPSLGVT